MMDYELFKRGIDAKEFEEKLLQKVLYSSHISPRDRDTIIILKGE